MTLKDLPKTIPGIDTIETLIVNDGSSDGTVRVAEKEGVDHILNLPAHKGLAEAFKRGLERALELGADIIANTDGDNQYHGEDITKLVKPILEKKAEIVIGCRDIFSIKHFSLCKKILQKMGSRVVNSLAKTDIPDATSGFRAYAREAAFKINIFSTYTYTLETLIQAGRKEIPMASVSIRTNEKLRESRLIKNILSYIIRSAATMMRIYLMYEPLKTFFKVSLIFVLPGIFLISRFLYFSITTGRSGHVQSLVIASVLVIMGFGIMVIGLLGEIIAANRKLNEEILYKLRRSKLEKL